MYMCVTYIKYMCASMYCIYRCRDINICVCFLSHLEHGSLRFSQLVERRFPSCHLYDGAAQRPDVGRFTISTRTFVYNFWSHVLERA